MTGALHALDYLETAGEYPPAAVCVAFGDERFLKRLVLKKLVAGVLGDETDTPYSTFTSDASWNDVLDELSTVALFGGERRLVVLEDADKFVTACRQKLEDYALAPRSSGVLIVDVTTWASNTRLFKIVAESGLQIDCRLPETTLGRSKNKVVDEVRLTRWLVDRARSTHLLALDKSAAERMLELVGPELGLLDQELAKLALFAGQGGKATADMVRDVVGGWRTQSIWQLADAAVTGEAAAALDQLSRMLDAGESPLAILGPLAWSLRRFAAATRIYEGSERRKQPVALGQALEKAGFRAWDRKGMEVAERGLKQLGRQRAARLYRWLLEADLAMKGSHSQADRARLVLEQLIVRMSSLAGSRRVSALAQPR